jgi:hypothetical protein
LRDVRRVAHDVDTLAGRIDEAHLHRALVSTPASVSAHLDLQSRFNRSWHGGSGSARAATDHPESYDEAQRDAIAHLQWTSGPIVGSLSVQRPAVQQRTPRSRSSVPRSRGAAGAARGVAARARLGANA